MAKSRGETDSEVAIIRPVGLDLYDVEETEGRLLTRAGGRALDWSADGEKIAFIGGNPLGRPNARTISTVDTDTGEVDEIYRLPPSDETDPPYLIDLTWSGDSKHLAFFVGGVPRHMSELWTIGADGSEPVRVLRTGEGGGAVAWSPDGQTFAWEGSVKDFPALMMAERPSWDPEMVEPYAYRPVWSKDGTQLAYVIGHEGHYAYRILVGAADGSNPKTVAFPKDARGGTSMEDWASC